jgi:hypothetical protein
LSLPTIEPSDRSASQLMLDDIDLNCVAWTCGVLDTGDYLRCPQKSYAIKLTLSIKNTPVGGLWVGRYCTNRASGAARTFAGVPVYVNNR